MNKYKKKRNKNPVKFNDDKKSDDDKKDIKLNDSLAPRPKKKHKKNDSSVIRYRFPYINVNIDDNDNDNDTGHGKKKKLNATKLTKKCYYPFKRGCQLEFWLTNEDYNKQKKAGKSQNIDNMQYTYSKCFSTIRKWKK